MESGPTNLVPTGSTYLNTEDDVSHARASLVTNLREFSGRESNQFQLVQKSNALCIKYSYLIERYRVTCRYQQFFLISLIINIGAKL